VELQENGPADGRAGTAPGAFIARITRASMLEVLRQDYIRTARAKGVTEFRSSWSRPQKRPHPGAHSPRSDSRALSQAPSSSRRTSRFRPREFVTSVLIRDMA
jgi:hypothetical protein